MKTRSLGDSFVKGEVEGVAAAEAGNNGVAGATLIPLLALGIPGDVITAIILGALMIHGLQPGPLMFVMNADIIYGLFIGLIVSSVFLFFIGSLAIRGFKHVASVPPGVLFPCVMVLCSTVFSQSRTICSMLASCSPWAG